MHKQLAAVAVLALIATPALAQQKTAPSSASGAQASAQKVPAEAKTFANKVAAANTFEIESSKLAEQRGTSSEVKQFAQQMVTDHTKAGEDFKAALQAANMTPPPEQPNAADKATLAKLQKAQGAAFEKMYVSAQLKAHKQAVALFRSYAKSGKTAQLKTFAQNTLPTLEHHLQMIQSISSQNVASRKH
jgi:putative membrane protein